MPPESLDYEPVPGRRISPKQLLVRVAKLFVLIYVLAVGVLASLKFLLPFKMLPWPEMIYGPAITMGSCFVLFAAAIWIGSRRDRWEA